MFFPLNPSVAQKNFDTESKWSIKAAHHPQLVISCCSDSAQFAVLSGSLSSISAVTGLTCHGHHAAFKVRQKWEAIFYFGTFGVQIGKRNMAVSIFFFFLSRTNHCYGSLKEISQCISTSHMLNVLLDQE